MTPLDWSIFPKTFVACSLAGVLCGLVGSFLMWKRLGLMGDALSHASLPGAAVALVLKWPVTFVLIPFSFLISQILAWLESRNFKQLDSYLAILFSGCFGLGILILHFSGIEEHEVIDLLLGDILSIDHIGLVALFLVTVLVVAYLHFFRKTILLLVLNPELASLEGVSVRLHGAILLGLCGLAVATCLRLTGVVLLTSLLTVPPMLAQTFSKTARGQFVQSGILGLGIANIGLSVAFVLRLPIGPTIAVVGFCLFVLRSIFIVLRRGQNQG